MPTELSGTAQTPRGRTVPGRHRATAADGTDSGWLLLVAVVAMLCVTGLMMVLSASSVEALRRYGGAWYFFQRQAIWVAIGGLTLLGVAAFDYRRWKRLVIPMVAASVVLLVVVLVPGVGITAGGSTRWLGAGWLRVQPSELAKLAVLLFGADLLDRRRHQLHDWRAVLKPMGVTTGLLVGLVLLQPDMGTAMLMVLVVLALLFVGGVPLATMGTLGLAAAVASVGLAKVEGYRWTRVLSFRDPFGDPTNTGYQLSQSLVALGTGGLDGVGLGASRAKWGFLPNAHTDFIFAIIGEELGLLGTLLVLTLFVAFATLGVRVALRAPDRFGTLVAAGATAWVTSQAVVNMGAVIGLLPITGVPLPFVSFGGSSLVVTMAATGILLNVARQSAPGRSRTGSGGGR